MNRNRVSAVILFWLVACAAMLAATSCRRETPVSEHPAEIASKAPSSPVEAPPCPPVPSQAKSAIRALAAIPAPASASQKRRAVAVAESVPAPGHVRWLWRWEPSDEGNPDLTGQTVTVTILIDRQIAPYGSTFKATGRVSAQRVSVDLPSDLTDGHYVGAVLRAGDYETGKGVPERILR